MGDYCRRKAEDAALAKWADCPDFDWTRPRMLARPIGVAANPPPTARERELTEALQRTKAALHLLQPALNVMARECLGDIIAREIDPALAQGIAAATADETRSGSAGGKSPTPQGDAPNSPDLSTPLPSGSIER